MKVIVLSQHERDDSIPLSSTIPKASFRQLSFPTHISTSIDMKNMVHLPNYRTCLYGLTLALRAVFEFVTSKRKMVTL